MKQLVLKIEEAVSNCSCNFCERSIGTIVKPVSLLANGEQEPRQYDFSDLAGILEWKGDAVTQQRLLRDEC